MLHLTCLVARRLAPVCVAVAAVVAPAAWAAASSHGGVSRKHGHRAAGAKPAAAAVDASSSSDPNARSGRLVGRTEVMFLGHAGWQVRTPGGALLLIDPWLDSPKAPAKYELPEVIDAILVTHGHFDHVGTTVALARRTGAKVIGSFELLDLLGLPEAQRIAANPGGDIVVRDVTLHLTEAVHSSSLMKNDVVHYAGAAMGAVLSIKHSVTLYHAGDTEVFASMQLIGRMYRPEVAMLPIGGHFTMGPRGAAEAARLLGVKTVLPMHYGTFPQLTGTPEELRARLPAGVAMQAPEPGAMLTF